MTKSLIQAEAVLDFELCYLSCMMMANMLMHITVMISVIQNGSALTVSVGGTFGHISVCKALWPLCGIWL